MVAKAQSMRVGLFAAATLVLLGVVVVVFGGVRVWDDVDRYHLVSAGSVIGLQPGAQVYLNGIKVGTVDDVGVLPEDLRKVSIAIKLKHGTPVRTDTQAVLQYAGITGLKVIDLRGGTTGARPLPPGSEIAVGAGVLDKLEAQAQTIVEQSTALVQRANRLTDNLIAMTDSLGSLTEPARRATENLAALTGSLRATVDDNRAALHETLVSIRQAASGTSALIEGRVGQLLSNAGDLVSELRKVLLANEGPLRAAVFDLRQASRSFKELARDVRQKPSRLLFSKTPPERQLP
jgi:phospholipid/cholesterol/gamma-HCH transport system substrate-binding protein